MDQAIAEKTIRDFIDRLGLAKLEVGELPYDEVRNLADSDFKYGFEVADAVTGLSVYLAYYRVSPSGRPGFRSAPYMGFGSWHYKDIPMTRDSPPDVDVIEGPESQILYPVIKAVTDVILAARLEYAHMAFGEDDET